MFDETYSQIVEQFGVRRFCSLRTEIVHRAYDSFAKVPSPNAIDKHARYQGILGRDHPLRESQTAIGAVPFRVLGGVGEFERMLRIVEDQWKSGLHFGARRQVIAARKNVSGRRRFRSIPGSFDVVRRNFGLVAALIALQLDLVLPFGEFRIALFHLLVGDDILGRVAVHFEVGIGLDIFAHLKPRGFVRDIASRSQFAAVLLVGGFQQIVHAAEGFGVVAGHILDPGRSRGFVHVEHHAAGPRSVIQVGGQPVLRIPDRLIDRHQLVVVTLQERIKLMVVTAGALDGHTHQRRETRLHRLLLRIEILVDFVNGLVIGDVGGGAHEAGGGERLDLVGRRNGEVFVVD